jgi:hypothetical protein
MQTTSRAVRSQRIENLKKLLRKVEVAAEGSPGLDREIARVFPSAPANVSRSIDALVRLIETELPGWWWTFGYCKLSNDASLYPPVSPRFRQQFSTHHWALMVARDRMQMGCSKSRNGASYSMKASIATCSAAQYSCPCSELSSRPKSRWQNQRQQNERPRLRPA